jgi:hypothetical protein
MGCVVVTLVLAVSTTACGNVNVALGRLSEARHIAADLHVQFTKATDASNRAVMATQDGAAAGFAAEAEQAKQAIQTDIDRLGVILRELNLPDEIRLLQTFETQYARYRDLDGRVLSLALENSNQKAQRLAFGPAFAAADACRDAVDAAAGAAPVGAHWQARTLAATAVASVREIQALHGPHIVDPDDAAMTAMETRMNAAQASARLAIAELTAVVGPRGVAQTDAAKAAFEQFLAVNHEIVVLSRRNTNVQSLILSLTDKRKLIPESEATLAALRSALAKRGYPAGRTSEMRPRGIPTQHDWARRSPSRPLV